MGKLQRTSELQDWFDEHTSDQVACVALRTALRGLAPLFGVGTTTELHANHCFVVNVSLIHIVRPDLRDLTLSCLQKYRNLDSITEANLAVGRVKEYEAAAARRQSRASSLDERFADGVLRSAASQTNMKLRVSKSRAEIAAAKALGAMTAGSLLGRQSPLEIIGLLNRIQATHERVIFWESIEHDCRQIDLTSDPVSVFARPLWNDDTGSSTGKKSTEAGKDGFWEYWYRGFEFGEPLDWNLLADVALLCSAERALETGLLSEKIATLELQHLRSLAYQPERIAISSESGLFTVIPDTPPDDRRYENLLRKVQDDVNRIRLAGPSNQYAGLGDIIDIVERAINDYKAEPMFVHDDFIKSLRMIIRRIERGELPSFDDNIENLIEDLNTGCIDIRAFDAGVADSVAARTKAKLRKPNEYEEASLIREISIRAAQSDEHLAAQLNEDGKTLSSLEDDGSHAADPVPEQAAQRIANRLPQMQVETRDAKKSSGIDRVVEAADKAMKLSKGAEAVGSVAKHGWGWLNYLISMF